MIMKPFLKERLYTQDPFDEKYMNNARLIDYIKNELTDEKCAEMLWNLMKYVYKKATD